MFKVSNLVQNSVGRTKFKHVLNLSIKRSYLVCTTETGEQISEVFQHSSFVDLMF